MGIDRMTQPLQLGREDAKTTHDSGYLMRTGPLGGLAERLCLDIPRATLS